MNWDDKEHDLMEGEPAEAMGLMQCLVGVFISPVKTFRSLTIKTHILWPLVIIVVATVATTLLGMGAMESFSRLSMESAMARNPQQVSPEMIEAQLQMTLKFMIFLTPFIALITPLVKGLITQGTAKLFDGKGTMRVTISVICLAYMIAIVGGLVRLPLMMASNTLVTFSPAMFMGADQLGSPWASFLMNFDLFTLWYLGVSAIGIKEVHKISLGKASVAVLLPFALILFMSLSGVLMEKMMG